MTKPEAPNSGHIVAGTEPTPVNLRREGAIISDVRGADIKVTGAHVGPQIDVSPNEDTAQTRLPVVPGNLTAIEINLAQKNITRLRADLQAHYKTCRQCESAMDKKTGIFCDVGLPMIVERNRLWDLIQPQVRRG